MGDTRVSLTHHFLIAMPSMADPHFSRTLTFICEHNDQGALGVVVLIIAVIQVPKFFGTSTPAPAAPPATMSARPCW